MPPPMTPVRAPLWILSPEPFRRPRFRLISRVQSSRAARGDSLLCAALTDRTWMKLTIERAALLKALGHVQSVVERRNTIPILSNVLLSAGQGQVAFSATDLDMEVTDSSPAQIESPGQITAPAHTLHEIVRKLPEGADVSLSYTGDDPRLQVAAGRSRFNLPVLPAGDL